MNIMLLVFLVALILVAGLSIWAFYYMQLKNARRAQADKPTLSAGVPVELCSRCQQARLIIKKDPGLCAFCWSSINTKQVS